MADPIFNPLSILLLINAQPFVGIEGGERGVEGVEEQLTATAACVQSGDADTRRQPRHAAVWMC